MRTTKQDEHGSAMKGERSSSRPIALALALIVALPYLSGLGNEFLWLDHSEIVEGALTVSSLEHVPRLFSDDNNFSGYHRPIYNLMHSLDRWVWGLDPFGYYLSSLALHALNAVLLFAVLRGLAFSSAAAFTAGAVFGLHPLASAVAGLIHSKADLLATMFLLTMVLGVQRMRSGSIAGGVIACLSLVLALFTKELGFLAPVGLLLFLPQMSRWAGEARWRITAFVVFAWTAAGLVAAWRMGRDQGSYESELGLGERVLTFGAVYVDYVRKIIVPIDPSIADTVTPFFDLSTAAQWSWMSVLCLLLGLQIAVAHRYRYLARWLALFHLALLPVAQLVPLLHFRADRFLYVPILCMACLAVDAARRVVLPRQRRYVVWIVAGYVLVASVLISRRVQQFESNETLFLAEVERTADYTEGLSVLARHYDQHGDFARAEPYWRRALATYPGRVSFLDFDAVLIGASYNDLALGHVQRAYDRLLSRIDEVGADFKEHARYNLAVAAWRLKKYDEAYGLLRAYGEAYSNHASCQFLLGRTCMVLGHYAEARKAFYRYLAIVPNAADRVQVEAMIRQSVALERS